MRTKFEDDLMLIAAATRMLRDGSARRLREACGISQGQVAAACGVTPGAVCRWEKLERIPRTAGALRYARLLARLNREAGGS